MLNEEGSDNCTENGITERGFLNLMRLFILREHPDTVWDVLISNGVNEDLLYEGDQLEWIEGERYELSEEGQTFLKNVCESVKSVNGW